MLSFILTDILTYNVPVYIDFVQQMSLQSDNMSISSSKDANSNRDTINSNWDTINSRNTCNSIFGDNCNNLGTSNIWDKAGTQQQRDRQQGHAGTTATEGMKIKANRTATIAEVIVGTSAKAGTSVCCRDLWQKRKETNGNIGQLKRDDRSIQSQTWGDRNWGRIGHATADIVKKIG